MTDEFTTGLDPAKHNFFTTKEYKRFSEFCEDCKRDKYVGLCYGPPGVGKSNSAHAYSNWDEVERLYEQLSSRWKRAEDDFVAPLSVRLYDTAFVIAPVVNSARAIEKYVHSARWRLASLIESSYGDNRDIEIGELRYTRLIIVDEADRLKLQVLEQLRSIFDESKVGIVLIGMPGMEKRLSRYPQLYSRVGFVHEFRTLSQDEMIFLIEQHLIRQLNLQDFTDREALSAIVRITQGNFRLLMRLLAQIKRILEINKLQTVTKEVVDTARESLVIGLL